MFISQFCQRLKLIFKWVILIHYLLPLLWLQLGNHSEAQNKDLAVPDETGLAI